jgi:hypothetical protein
MYVPNMWSFFFDLQAPDVAHSDANVIRVVVVFKFDDG